MAKRFIDSAIWEKAWFRGLSPAHKCAWVYILSRCDAVGVWDADKELAEFCIGSPVDWDSLISSCNGNIEVLPNGKWWLVDFCSYQYGDLTETCTPHRKYLSMLKKHGLLERVVKGYRNPFDTLQEEEEKEEEVLYTNANQEEAIASRATPKKPTKPAIQFDYAVSAWDGISDAQVSEWAGIYPALDIDRELGKAKEWVLANPTKRKHNWRRFLVNWFGRAQERGGDKQWKR